jgi:general stress protein YciG
MAGTKEGARKAYLATIERHGADFYSRIGRKGGKNGHTGGFYANRELARRAGAIGGRKSRRGASKKDEYIQDEYVDEVYKKMLEKEGS